MKPSRCPVVVVLGVLFLLSAVRLLAAEPAAAEDPKAAVKPVSADAPMVAEPMVAEKVRQLMQDRDYPEAVKAIEEAAKDEKAPRDYLAYLKGRALYLQKQYDQSAEAFDGLLGQFPESPWARRARFGKALALARKGDFRAAELIVRAQAEHLLSADRKQQIADVYLEFADAYFKPPELQQKPDYKKALEFYQKALEVGPKPDKRIEVELLVAQCQQEMGQHAEAAKLYEKFIADHPDGPLDVEARYRLGECRLAEGNLKLARRTWQDLLAEHADSPSERIAEATFKLSRTWKIPKPDNDEQLALGTAALEAFIKRFGDHELAGQAHLQIAQANVHRGRYEDAVSSLKRFLADGRYQDREQVPDARHLLGRSYQLQKKFTDALTTWKEYLSRHPAHKAWSSVQREIINTEYLMGQEELSAKQYDQARKLWNEFLAKYPLDGRNPKILLAFGRMDYEQKKFDESIAAFRRLVSKYPKTDEASHAQFSIGAILDETGKLEEALEEYRKVTWGKHQGHAKQAVARLTAKSMTVATERVFRSDEVPRLKLTTRNIEKVTVRAYTVDMETYFRKMHLARGVETLDIALIDPDRTFEFPVPDYAKYQKFENPVEVPLPDEAKSGVMAVTVSSETLQATTLLIQSDLDVIVKSSRDEVFVFAENMLTGKPWEDVRLLISNGSRVFAEAATGPDGVWKQSCKELKDAGDVRVFAIAEGSVASNVIGLGGVGVARGLSNKGYIYTDRPAYRAGQMVHVRGCLRHVPGAPDVAEAAPEPEAVPDGPGPLPGETADADVYTIQQGKKYTLEVFDGRNRLLRQQEVTLSQFGTFHANFVLPAASPQGKYRVLAREAEPGTGAAKTYQGTFLVHEYRLEPVHLAVDTPRNVYYRGEEIEGTIKAAYYYGAPLAGREIRYQLADGRLHTATTDAKGEVKFKLPTREFRETQVLPMKVTLPQRNLQAAVNFVLASRGFAIGVGTVRPVYVAGETFEASINTHDAEGKPVARKLVLKVLEKTTVQGKVGERLVEQHPLETDEKDGQARQTLKLDAGGRYVLRAEGTDRFDNPVSAEHAVQVSDDEDRVRLRILADTHTYKVGDTGTVNLHWREDPALALITFQGARVLDYKLLELATGANELKIPMTARLAPNFELAVAVMTDPRGDEGEKGEGGGEKTEKKPVQRFHAASSPFTVQRELLVTIVHNAGEGPVRPGDEIEVTITTTDPLGKPVATELSLAMIEQSLLERFAWQVPSIQDFFRGTPRKSAVRTTSSVTFAYSPSTRPINARLLAERDRVEVERAEEESLAITEAYAFAERGGRDLTAHLELGGTDATSEDAPAEPPDNGDGRAAGERGSAPAGAAAPEVPELTRRRNVRAGSGGMGFGGGRGFGTAAGFGLARTPGQQGAARLQLGVQPRVAGVQEDYALFYRNQLGSRRSERYSSLTLATRGHQITADADQLGLLVENDFAQVTVLAGDGIMQQWDINGNGVWNDAVAGAMAARLNQAGAVLMPGLSRQETGYWNPAVTTDADGKATVKIVVPERSTAWTLMAKGITVETLAGEATEELVAKKELFGQLKLPMAFTDGDQAQVTASVHNDAVAEGQIEVTLKTTIAGRTVEDKKTLDVKDKGIQELVFSTTLRRPGPSDDAESEHPAAEVNVTFELTIAAGDKRDVVRRTVPLQANGMPVYATASGSATSDTTAWVEPPSGMELQSPSLQILVGPNVERSLMDIVLGPAPPCQVAAGRIAAGMESATSDLMASLALLKLLGGSREAGGPEAQAIDGRIRASLSLLVCGQNDDGGWSWTGLGGDSRRYSTARIVWAISLARDAGYTVPEDCFSKALGYLRTQIAATAESQYETKAILLHGLAAAGQGDFALANRLYRNRPALSNSALAYLALAFARMDRKSTAAELLDLLAGQDLDQGTTRRESARGLLPWSQSPAELRALFALGLQETSSNAAKLKELVDWLLAHRRGHRWSPDKATGPAAVALCHWFAQSRFQGERYTLTVFVNDVRVKVLDIDPTTGTQTIDVPVKHLASAESPEARLPGKQRINFQITGRGRYTYQCILGGFVPDEKLTNTTNYWVVKRTYQPAPLEVDGRPIPRGFGVLEGSYQDFKNPLAQLPVGSRGLVELEIRRHNVTSNTPEQHLEYLVVTEPIPSGTTVIEKSVSGPFERFEISPGAITFYIGSRRDLGRIRYELYGYLPGQYKARRTVVRNAHHPEQLMVADAKPLTVLPSGQTSADKYRLTPQELYELGKHHFGKGDWKTAGGHLAELTDKWNLQAKVYKHAVQMLLDVHLEVGPPAQVVRYFEIVKEKWPSQEIPFDKIVKVGAAYHEMGEYERSYLIFRATVESSFMRESGVAGFLQAQGEFSRSIDVMGRLLREYPPEGYIASATYALAQQVYAKAPQAAKDEKLRKQKVNRVDLIRRAGAMLEGFLTAYPEDPAADQAAFAAASALLDLEAYQQAAAACNLYAARYPESDLLDSFWYMIGYCRFAASEHQAAMEMCRKVAEATRTDKTTGRQLEARNKWRAIYILGQVHHSLGKAAEAIAEYRRVDDRFPDAKQSIDYFTRKAIALPEVSTIKPGRPAEVELKFRNIPACDAKVYRIDLMKFSLLKRDLGRVTQINLAGIRPYHETTVELGDGKDYRDRTHKLPLPLKEQGAYLVVCRGENLHASGLVLLTPLAVEVQEDVASGRVRTTVKNTEDDSYLDDVHVKVIGSQNPDFISGETDLRGVFVADGIQGTSTVIARADGGRYAFFRGQTPLAVATPKEKSEAKPQRGKPPAAKPSASLKEELLRGLKETNVEFQGEQVEQLQQMFDAAPAAEGVEASKAF